MVTLRTCSKPAKEPDVIWPFTTEPSAAWMTTSGGASGSIDWLVAAALPGGSAYWLLPITRAAPLERVTLTLPPGCWRTLMLTSPERVSSELYNCACIPSSCAPPFWMSAFRVATWLVNRLIWPTVLSMSWLTDVDALDTAAAVVWKLWARELAAKITFCRVLPSAGAALQADTLLKKVFSAAGIPPPSDTGMAFWTAVRALDWALASPCAPACCHTSLSASRSRLSTMGPGETPPPRPTAGSKGSAWSATVCLAYPGVEALSMLFCVAFKAYWNACRALDAPSIVELKELMAFILKTRCARGCGPARRYRRPYIRGPSSAGLRASGVRDARPARAGHQPGESRQPSRLPGAANPDRPARPGGGCRAATPDNPAPRETA